jgi:hypothetical protein
MRGLIQTVVVLAIAWLTLPVAAHACAWPDTWLGAPDTAYLHLRLGVYFYGAVLDDMPGEQGASHLPLGGTAPDGTALPATKEAWLAQLAAMPETHEAAQQGNLNQVMAELEDARQFYWRNSRFNCAITFDLLTADEAGTPQLWSTLANADAPYYSPLGWAKYAGVAESGNYDGLVQICVLYRYNAKSGQLERVRGGGGFTEGCALRDETTGQKRCGWSWWAAPPADHECGSDWLFVHEFGHQLDSLFEQSGHPEHWFNHLARLEANTGPFGEHFDAMSYILRRTPEPDWRDLQWGVELLAVQEDDDGVPDGVRALLENGEWRKDGTLNNLTSSDPNNLSPDADRDGLPDYWELMATNGNQKGHGERWHPSVPMVSPTNPDSDGDGLQDGSDPLPYLSMPAYVLQDVDAPAQCAAVLPEGGDSPRLSVWVNFEADIMLEFILAWGSAEEIAGDAEMLVRLDLDADGWFNGDDNWRIELDDSGITRLRQNKAAADMTWPEDVAADHALAGYERIDPPAGYGKAALLQFKVGGVTGLQAKSGERIGINIGVRQKGQPRYYMLGEPNGFIPLTLR